MQEMLTAVKHQASSFFRNSVRYSVFLFVEYILEGATNRFETPTFLFQLFVTLHLKSVYARFKLSGLFVFRDLPDVYFEEGYFDKVFSILQPKAKFSQSKDGDNFWNILKPELYGGVYKIMFSRLHNFKRQLAEESKNA